MTTFDLTEAELKVARILVQSCLDGMGGKRPADLEHDEYTWIDMKDLMSKGYTRHQAAGFFSSLSEKGFILDYDPTMKDAAHWIVTTEGWKWMDTIWENQNV